MSVLPQRQPRLHYQIVTISIRLSSAALLAPPTAEVSGRTELTEPRSLDCPFTPQVHPRACLTTSSSGSARLRPRWCLPSRWRSACSSPIATDLLADCQSYSFLTNDSYFAMKADIASLAIDFANRPVHCCLPAAAVARTELHLRPCFPCIGALLRCTNYAIL